jgi:hypothetical protein
MRGMELPTAPDDMKGAHSLGVPSRLSYFSYLNHLARSSQIRTYSESFFPKVFSQWR